ncbi:MAG TPA: chemotaxis protein CheA [Anaeromyxobacter sp.]|nr:chemotaxis protein CheA [Anaeromyxobacter sp.]
MDELEIDREALLQTFRVEAEEIFGRMEQALVALEARPGDEELLHALFRDAHTLKGSAGLVSFDAVRDLAHDLEGVLERLRKRTLAVSDRLVTLLLRSVDVLRGAVADAAAGGEAPSEAVTGFRRRLAEAAAAEPAAPVPASPHEAAQEAAPAAPLHGGRTLRVDVSRLDRMLDLSGEIAISRGRLGEMLERRIASPEELLEAHREADRLYLDLQELIMKARMVPIGPSFHQHVRTVRDVATAQGKQARLVVEGEDVEVDTAVVEYVRDPLTHMVRNAIDHGVEPSEARRAAGKDPVGRVVLRAFHEAGAMVIQVADDGAGLDRQRIARKAAALGLADPARMTDEDLARVVFEPGFSTAEEVTEISGRGVGMDVVRRNVEALRGSVSIESEEGRGTTVTIRVPLTLAIIQGFKVGVAGEAYILPLDAVVECIELPREETAAGAPFGVVSLRGKPLPYLRLRRLFGTEGEPPARENVVVVQHGTGVAGIAVDALHGESSTVIKPLGTMFKGLPGVAGSSILGNGRVALILDVPGLLRETLRRAARDAAA